MAENRRGKDNRYYFSRGQMIILGGSFALASVVIFLIGMLVGKELEERKIIKKEEPLVRIPVKPATAGPAGAGAKGDEITFYDTLAKPKGGQGVAEPSAKEKKKPEKAAKTDNKETKAPAKGEATPVRVAENKAEKPAQAVEAKKAEGSESSEAKESGKIWRAQVDAFPDEKAAHKLVDRLKNKGYNAYVAEVQNKGKLWYRVSVGKYGSREEAEKVAESLKNKENYAKAFVASK